MPDYLNVQDRQNELPLLNMSKLQDSRVSIQETNKKLINQGRFNSSLGNYQNNQSKFMNSESGSIHDNISYRANLKHHRASLPYN